jgi:hypothetical protein
MKKKKKGLPAGLRAWMAKRKAKTTRAKPTRKRKTTRKTTKTKRAMPAGLANYLASRRGPPSTSRNPSRALY